MAKSPVGKCPYCPRPLGINVRGLVLKTCGQDVCKRAYRAEAKRRERHPEWYIQAPEKNSGPIETPFGTFETHQAAWMEVLNNEHYGREWDIHREWAEGHLDPSAVPTLDEFVSWPDAPADDEEWLHNQHYVFTEHCCD